MKEIISNKIDNMEELEDRTILKEIVREIFEGLIDYQEDFNKKLEDRVFNLIEDKQKNYDIYTTIIAREELKVVNDFLFPILDKDEEQQSEEEILEKIKEKDRAVIDKIFLSAEYEKIRSLKKKKKRTFAGEIVTEDKRHQLTLALEYNTEYIQAEKELYNIFLENTINWRTIYNPYIRRIFDVVVIDYEPEVEEITEYEKIEYDLEEFNEDIYQNYIPVWNIRNIFQKGEGFPVPARNTTNYDHFISIENLDLENGYLVVAEDLNVISVKKKEDDIVITSNESNSNPWELIEIIQDKRERERDFEFSLLSNSQRKSFVNKLYKNRENNIRTRADLERIINSYRDITEIKLEEINILEKEVVGQTYDFNSFIEDEIRENRIKKTLLLEFSSGVNNYLKYDMISFLVSEIQLYFPTYICKGVCPE